MDADVIVVGAGAAGLAAAIRLAERSARVIALDGRDRAGGRVRWDPVGTVDEPAELGAEFIHGDAPETSALLREARLSKVEPGDDAWICRTPGTLEPDDEGFGDNALFERVRTLERDESVATFLARFESDPLLRREARRMRMFVEGFEAADPARASIRAIADEVRSGVDSTTTRPVGGYAPLFTYLEERCAHAGAVLRLDTVVERIRTRPGVAELDVRAAGSATSTLRARCVVVTVPVGVLQQREPAVRLTFDPPLPPQKQAAIRGMEMGQAIRVTLAFRTPFWERVAGGRYRDASFFRCDGSAFNAFWTQTPVRSRTIVAWLGGPRTKHMSAMPAQERVARARDAFADMLGEHELTLRAFEGGVTHDWAADPLACGAYSYVTTGAATARADLAAPVGEELFFAGEATATDGQAGTVSGAFATGLRAADEVARTLDIAGAGTPAGS